MAKKAKKKAKLANPVKWTVLFRSPGRGGKQRRKRFEASDNFAEAKTLALSKISDNMYEGLYRWSDYDWAYAIQKARNILERKRLTREGKPSKKRNIFAEMMGD